MAYRCKLNQHYECDGCGQCHKHYYCPVCGEEVTDTMYVHDDGTVLGCPSCVMEKDVEYAFES